MISGSVISVDLWCISWNFGAPYCLAPAGLLVHLMRWWGLTCGLLPVLLLINNPHLWWTSSGAPLGSTCGAPWCLAPAGLLVHLMSTWFSGSQWWGLTRGLLPVLLLINNPHTSPLVDLIWCTSWTFGAPWCLPPAGLLAHLLLL